MSVNNNNAPVSLDNPFADLSSLKDANLTERETAILSKCNYKDLKPKWSEGLNNISNTYMRNVKEVKESFFCHLGNVLGFVNSEPLKEVHKVFSNFDLFDRYVRNDISPETYKKIAKANPAYFDKVIEHLEDSAKELDTKADARISTFCSSSTGYALAKAATRFRDTADYLKRMIHGDDAAKPGNNNANPGADRGQPTIINHYHNNIGHIGDNYFGDNHFGDNNFYNKGNMAVMFKGRTHGVPHTGFKSERLALESPNSYYSPIINGKRFLDLTSEQVVQIALEGNKDKGKKLERQRNDELTFEAEPLPEDNEQDVELHSTMRNLHSEFHVQKPKGNAKIYDGTQHISQKQQSQTGKKAKNINSVQPKQTAIEDFNSKLRQLRIMFFANWDAINKDLENGNNTGIKNNAEDMNFKEKLQFVKESAGDFGDEITLKSVGKELTQLINDLENDKKRNSVDGDHWSSLAPLLSGIKLMLSKDKTTAEKESNDQIVKSNNEFVEHKDLGITFSNDITENEQKDAKDLYQKGNYSANKLLKETLETIKYIREQTGLKKNNKPSYK